VKDGVFSQKILGEGVAIYPERGIVTAPADGVLTTLFPTGHALGITTDTGIELLIHLGLNTVQLQGKFFTPQVQQGAVVKKGQVLLEFDLKAIEAAGYSLVTPIVITNTANYTDIVESDATTITAGETLLTIIK